MTDILNSDNISIFKNTTLTLFKDYMTQLNMHKTSKFWSNFSFKNSNTSSQVLPYETHMLIDSPKP